MCVAVVMNSQYRLFVKDVIAWGDRIHAGFCSLPPSERLQSPDGGKLAGNDLLSEVNDMLHLCLEGSGNHAEPDSDGGNEAQQKWD